jgi:hypothetical protein
MSNLKWNNKLIPLPRTKTQRLDVVTQTAFGYIKINRPIVARLIKDNLTIEDGQAIAFLVEPDTQYKLWTSDQHSYLIETRLQPFHELTPEPQQFVLGPGETQAYLTQGEQLRIEQFDYGATRIRENTNEVVHEAGDAFVLDMSTEEWFVIENISDLPVRFEVGIA